MKSIVELIAEYASTSKECLCVVDADGEYTYEHVWKLIVVMSRMLLKLGIKPGTYVLVECTQDVKYLACLFACNLAGIVCVPIEHKASKSRVLDIEREVEAEAFIGSANYEVECRTIRYDEIIVELTESDGNTNSCAAVVFPELDAVSEILFTTGTTGKSKGIEITHRNNIALAENICSGTEMRRENVELIPLPISHSHGLRTCYANFSKCGTVVLTDSVIKIKYIYELIEKYSVTALDLSPTAAAFMLKLSKGRMSDYNNQLDYIEIGTAVLSEEIKQKLCETFPSVRLYNFYGSTESGRSCTFNFNSCDNKKFCIGYPTVNSEFIITDEARNEIESSKDNTGLVACRGPMNMKGYFRQEELTNETMRNGYIYTNDEGYIDEKGLVYVLGRHDDVINYKGIKIAPEEIEEIVVQYPGITDCACIPEKDETSGQIPKLVLALDKDENFDKSNFAVFLANNIDSNKLPKKYEIIDKIPRASNGKLQRKKLLR